MPSSTDYKLKFEIAADARSAKAELKDVDKLIGKLGGNKSLSGVLNSAKSDFGSLSNAANKAAGSIPIPFAAAAGAIAGIGAAAIGAGSALFTLVKNASDFGSELHDIADKTGLSAAAVSTLKYNADNAGSSLEAVSGGISKFAKLIGQAADGSKEAQKTLKDLGVTSTDLDTAMDQAFHTIAKMPDGIQQMVAAQKLYGKSGADLIPVIKQMNGEFDATIEAAKKLGITLTEEDLKAADDFGDTLGLLQTQAKVTASTFALQFAPVITDAMKKVSKSFSENKETVREWGQDFKAAMVGASTVGEISSHIIVDQVMMVDDAIRKLSLGLLGIADLWDIATLGASKYLRELKDIAKGSSGQAGLGNMGGGVMGLRDTRTGPDRGATGAGLNFKYGHAKDYDVGKTGGGGGGKRAGGGKTPEQLERERIQGIKRDTADELALRAAVDSTVLAMIQKRVALSNTSEMQGLEQANRVAMDTLMFKRKVLADELTAVRGNAEEETRITREQALLDQEIKKTRAEQETSEFELAKKGRGAAYDLLVKEIDKQVELREELTKTLAVENERFDLIVKQREEEGAFTLDRDKPGQPTQPGFGGMVSQGLGDVFGAVSSTDQNGAVKSQAQFMTGVWADAADGITQSIGQITGAMSDMLVQMIMTGEFSAKAALQMAAGVALGLAMQAGIKAIFEVAEGIAAAANPFTAWQAPMHFAAAKTYAIVAAVAGGAGVGLAMGARAAGGGSKKSASGGSYGHGGSSSSPPKRSEDLTPYSRQSQDAFMSGRHSSDPAAAMVARAIEKLVDRIDSKPAHEVLTTAIRQKPGIIGHQVARDIGSNSGIGKAILQKSGVR